MLLTHNGRRTTHDRHRAITTALIELLSAYCKQFDIISFQETWQSSTNEIQEMLPGFVNFDNPRKVTTKDKSARIRGSNRFRKILDY